MDSLDEHKGQSAPDTPDASASPLEEAAVTEHRPGLADGAEATPADVNAAAEESAPEAEEPHADSYDKTPYPSVAETAPSTAEVEEERVPATPPIVRAAAAPPAPPPPEAPSREHADEEEEEEEGMLRMSFLEHLEELRSRLIKVVAGIGVAFLVSLIFANDLWIIVSEPATAALKQIGVPDPRLAQITPMEVFNTVWIKLPLLSAIFLASPWALYQVWAFIAPGLYKRERRWAAPFVICSAGLFILGGVFAYFVAFRFGLTFLLGIGRDIRIQPVVSVTEYFDLFVNVTLAIGLVFELPVLIFFLTLLRIVSPSFLLRNTRYAVLIIVILAAIITPTPDVVNLMIFSVPMILLFFGGTFASYLLVLHREQRRFPWGRMLAAAGLLLALLAGGIAYAVLRLGYDLVWRWPFLVR
jgi:sec-independent protein translocase protein TatC